MFPYNGLDDAIKVAEGVFGVGGGACGLDALAVKLDHATVNSGTFGQKIATAVIFGVVVKDGQDLKLTDLGYRIIDAQQAAQAKVDAFLGVPLYRRIYDFYRGRTLPPTRRWRFT